MDVFTESCNTTVAVVTDSLVGQTLRLHFHMHRMTHNSFCKFIPAVPTKSARDTETDGGRNSTVRVRAKLIPRIP